MSFKTGDKVKVITKNSTYEGRTGTVVHVFEDGRTVTITFDPASGMISGFFNHELELVVEAETETYVIENSAEGFTTAVMDLTPSEVALIERMIEQFKDTTDEYAPTMTIKKEQKK